MKGSIEDRHKLQKDIGKRIREIRNQRDVSLSTLSANCHMDKPNLSKLETGKTNPTLYMLKRIADYFEISLSELLDFDS